MTLLFKLSLSKKVQTKQVKPPIPLIKPKERSLKTGKYHTYNLCANPTVALSPAFELAVPYFSTGMCKKNI